jgi:hypothetical protein
MTEQEKLDTGNEEIPDADEYESKFADFYKPEADKWSFKLKDLLVKDRNCIWDNTNKEFKRDTIIDAADREKQVANALRMPKEVFEKAFPGCRKQFRKERLISVEGNEYVYQFKLTQNDEIDKAIASVRGLGQDPLQVTYTLEKKTKDNTKLTTTTPFNNICYTVTPSMEQEEDMVDTENKDGQPPIEKAEKDIYEAVMKNPEEFRTEKAYVQAYKCACEKTGDYEGKASDDRAKWVYKKMKGG